VRFLCSVFCVLLTSVPSCFVALKIMVADLPDSSREARILKRLADESSVDIQGSQHVLSLKDNFQIAGPNGTHEVLVTEVLASLSDLGRYPVYNKVRRVHLQVALAFNNSESLVAFS
jgi:hypothetical protein